MVFVNRNPPESAGTRRRAAMVGGADRTAECQYLTVGRSPVWPGCPPNVFATDSGAGITPQPDGRSPCGSPRTDRCNADDRW